MAKLLEWKRIKNRWPGRTVPMPEGYTYRAEVPGGWLVSVWAGDEKMQVWGGGLTFVPDANHEWKVKEDKPRRPG
jgi:hypothetical protein